MESGKVADREMVSLPPGAKSSEIVNVEGVNSSSLASPNVVEGLITTFNSKGGYQSSTAPVPMF